VPVRLKAGPELAELFEICASGVETRDLFFCWLYDTTMTMSKNPSSQGLFGGASAESTFCHIT
jgi:hypothetical protein